MKILTFRILSPENPKFVRDIDIPDEKRFYDLHMGIQAACNYDYTQMTSFYLSNENWEKLEEISMMPQEEDIESKHRMMKETLLKDLLHKKGQRLLYLFDFFSVRMMFIEVVNVRDMTATEAKLNYPRVVTSEGDPPPALIVDDFDSELDDFDINDSGDYDEPESFENIDDLDI
ncbi:MAG: IS1096 element passenger TnpR family protein [Bacteroidota bacterium]